MPITLAELDGNYEVRSSSLDDGKPHTVDGDGTTEIRNGLTYRKDKNGLIWESAFSIAGPKQVQMESTVDPSHAANPIYVRDASGNPTTGMLTFRTVLDVTREGGKLVLSGTIAHGTEKTRLILTKIS
jgi:hypothetical protein